MKVLAELSTVLENNPNQNHPYRQLEKYIVLKYDYILIKNIVCNEIKIIIKDLEKTIEEEELTLSVINEDCMILYDAALNKKLQIQREKLKRNKKILSHLQDKTVVNEIIKNVLEKYRQKTNRRPYVEKLIYDDLIEQCQIILTGTNIEKEIFNENGINNHINLNEIFTPETLGQMNNIQIKISEMFNLIYKLQALHIISRQKDNMITYFKNIIIRQKLEKNSIMITKELSETKKIERFKLKHAKIIDEKETIVLITLKEQYEKLHLSKKLENLFYERYLLTTLLLTIKQDNQAKKISQMIPQTMKNTICKELDKIMQKEGAFNNLTKYTNTTIYKKYLTYIINYQKMLELRITEIINEILNTSELKDIDFLRMCMPPLKNIITKNNAIYILATLKELESNTDNMNEEIIEFLKLKLATPQTLKIILNILRKELIERNLTVNANRNKYKK